MKGIPKTYKEVYEAIPAKYVRRIALKAQLSLRKVQDYYRSGCEIGEKARVNLHIEMATVDVYKELRKESSRVHECIAKDCFVPRNEGTIKKEI